MQKPEKRIKIMYGVTLYNLLKKMLFVQADGDKVEERDLPFGVKYKLQKDFDIVAKDYSYFENERVRLVKEYGEEDGDRVVVKDENIEEYKNELLAMMNKEVVHTFAELTEAEILSLDGVKTECHEMELFIRYLTEDGCAEEEIPDEEP